MAGDARRQSSVKRLLYILVPFLLALQIGTFVSMRLANRAIARDTLDSELSLGAEAFRYAAAQRGDHLYQAAELVAKDFGFREAITRAHRPTIESALNNQRVRLRAGLVVLTDRDGRVLGTGAAPGRDFTLPDDGQADQVLAAQSREARDGELNLLPMTVKPGRQALYQWVKTTVRTPTPTAYLSFGFEINDRLANQFKQMTNLNYVFLSREKGGPWAVNASSFDPRLQTALDTRFGALDKGFWTLPAEGGDYRMMTFDLGGGGDSQVVAVVGRSFDSVVGPFARLEDFFGVLTLVTALVSVVAVYRVTHSIVTPLDEVIYQDALTRLANRRLFELNLKLAAQNLKTLGRGYSLMVMDLNKFKAINDTLGHATGDLVLKEAAQRIQGVIRSSDTIARLGGDEFALLLLTDDRHKAAEIATMIVDRVCRPIPLAQGRQVEVGVSIGIAMAPEDGIVTDDLLHLADEAMYAAKVGHCGFTFSRHGDRAVLEETEAAVH